VSGEEGFECLIPPVTQIEERRHTDESCKLVSAEEGFECLIPPVSQIEERRHTDEFCK